MKIEEKLKKFSYNTDLEYREDINSVSSHFLMSFIENKINKNYEDPEKWYKPYFTQGHLLEDLIFNEDITKLLDKEYLIIDFEPTETLQKLISFYIGSEFPHKMKTKAEKETHLLKIIKERKLWSSIKDETKLINKFDTVEFWNYLNNMFADKPKEVLSRNQYTVVESSAERIKKLSILENLEDNLFFVHPMYNVTLNILDYKFKAKAQFDLLIYNSQQKKIYIIDFKTTSNAAGNFGLDYRKYKLYLQSYWYKKVLEQILQDEDISITFYFAVVSKTYLEEKALLIRDDLLDLPENPMFNETKLFNDLNNILNKQKIKIEDIVNSYDSPQAIINKCIPNISSLIN